ncbi:MAG: phenylacetate--CoA ligase family protein, partial [Alphaproteobacteria bacterium]
TKAMLRESQEAHPPFGDYLATPPERVMRLHRTSGTTGRAVNIAISEADAAEFRAVGGRAYRCGGLGPGHRAIHCLNYMLWVGGFTDHLSVEASGATVIPFGVGHSELLIRTIRETGVTVLLCTVSYPAVLERVLAERFPGLAPKDLGLEIAILTGEAGLESPAFRARVEGTWGFKARNLYGVSDIATVISAECPRQHDMHFIVPDFLYREFIDPDTGAPVPFEEGAVGELVLTSLARECQPLVRFRTNDIARVTGTGACACGRTAPRFRLVGRADDMVVVRGVNVFPSAVATVIERIPELSGEFRIVLKGPPPYDRLPVEAELKDGEAPSERLAESVARAIKDVVRATPAVTLVPPYSLPRTADKPRRLIRQP